MCCLLASSAGSLMGRWSPGRVAGLPGGGCDTVESADADSTGARQVRIRLLGEVGVVTDRGESVDVGPAKCQAVLAALALSAGTPVPVWRLVDVVWGDDPPRTADRTLQSYLARLRKSLGSGSIVRAGAAYRLDVPAGSVDVLRFQQRLDAGD